MDVTFRACTVADAARVAAIGRETFCDTFAALNTPENMAAYLASAFSLERIRAELADPGSAFLFLQVDGETAGWLKVSEGQAQTDLREADGLEIERIYVRRPFQGRGLGRALMEKAIEIARRKGKRYVWLGVWERNEAAIGFYRRMGFAVAGTHAFVMGAERQTDYVMRRELQGRERG